MSQHSILKLCRVTRHTSSILSPSHPVQPNHSSNQIWQLQYPIISHLNHLRFPCNLLFVGMNLQSLPHISSHFATLRIFLLGSYSLSPSLQHFISNIHNDNFTIGIDASARALHGYILWGKNRTSSKTHWSGHNTIPKRRSDLSNFCNLNDFQINPWTGR